MIPARYRQVVFSLVLSGLMSFLVSGISTVKSLGLVDGFVGLWLSNWAFSWAVAFPAVLVVAPITHRVVARLVADAPEAQASRASPASRV